MNDFLEKNWAFFPILSAILMMLAFYPTRIWPLAFISLVPFFYFLHSYGEDSKKIFFWAGFLFGTTFALAISYTTFIQFHWLQEAHLFTSIIRLFFIPLTLISGVIWGGLAVLYVYIKTRAVVIDAILLAFMWVVIEGAFAFLFAHYNIAMLAYTVAEVPTLVQFAALGGVLLVSFLIALFNSFLASFIYTLVKRDTRNFKILGIAGAGMVVFLAIFLGAYTAYFQQGNLEEKKFSVALIQNLDRKDGAFGSFTDGVFNFKLLEKLVVGAAEANTDLIIYPFSPYLGALTIDEKNKTRFTKDVISGTVAQFEQWVDTRVPSGIPLLTWGTIFRNGAFSFEFDLWRDGKFQSYYQKRSLFPFIDYTPAWAQKIGFYSTPYDGAPGLRDQAPLNVDGHKFSSLICSEVYEKKLVRRDADIILALGSDAMFLGDAVGQIDLIITQYHAAEYNKPAIRGNRFGPSALIDQKGHILQLMKAGEEGVLRGDLVYRPNRRTTLYSKIGDWGFWGLAALYIGFMVWFKRRSR